MRFLQMGLDFFNARLFARQAIAHNRTNGDRRAPSETSRPFSYTASFSSLAARNAIFLCWP